jgi:hypothetical protein
MKNQLRAEENLKIQKRAALEPEVATRSQAS